MSYKKL